MNYVCAKFDGIVTPNSETVSPTIGVIDVSFFLQIGWEEIFPISFYKGRFSQLRPLSYIQNEDVTD